MSALSTIQDLLPNEQLLNFYTGVPTLPEWLPQHLTLIMGAGDLDQEGLNVDQFSMFDVFYCEPWDVDGSLRKNVKQLLTRYKKKKIICFLDHRNRAHRQTFVNLFKGRFKYIDGYDGHTPHFQVQELEQLLTPGGEAVNIEETSEFVLEEMDLYTLLKEKPYSTPLTYNEVVKIHGPIQFWETNDTEQLKIYRQYIFSKLFTEFKKPKLKYLGPYDKEGEDPKTALYRAIDLYYLHKKYEPILPDTMKAEIKLFERPWQEKSYMTFVLTKLPAQGGSLKKSNTKKKKTRKSKARRQTYVRK